MFKIEFHKVIIFFIIQILYNSIKSVSITSIMCTVQYTRLSKTCLHVQSTSLVTITQGTVEKRSIEEDDRYKVIYCKNQVEKVSVAGESRSLI